MSIYLTQGPLACCGIERRTNVEEFDLMFYIPD